MNKLEHQKRLDDITRLRKYLRNLNNRMIDVLKEIMAINTELNKPDADGLPSPRCKEYHKKLEELSFLKASLTTEKEEVSKICQFASQKLTQDINK